MITRKPGRPLGRPGSFVAAFALCLALLAPGARPAQAITATEVAASAFDVAVLRPLNATALLLGSVFFVASVPLVAPFEGLATSWDVFVYAPYEYTVLRPIGEL